MNIISVVGRILAKTMQYFIDILRMMDSGWGGASFWFVFGSTEITVSITDTVGTRHSAILKILCKNLLESPSCCCHPGLNCMTKNEDAHVQM
jgi:hypothetical protein